MKNRFLFNQFNFSEQEADLTKPFELITTAKQADPYYGDFSYTKEELQEMADNFNSNVAGVEIAVDINHDNEKKAYAWIEPNSMYVAESVNLQGEYSLFGKLYRYTPEGEELIKTGAYRYFSLEIRSQVDKFVNGVKQAYNNVIRGLALTNSPVIKGLSPTFSEKKILFNNFNNMEFMKLFLAELSKKPTVSLSEKATVKTLLAKLSEEEQAEVAEEVATVEALPEVEAEANAEVEAKVKAEAEAKELAERKLSETDKKLAEQARELAELKLDKKVMLIDKKMSEVILSETVQTGLVGESVKLAKDFAMKLSEDDANAFFEIIKKVQTVQFGEIGTSADIAEDDKAIVEKAKALSEKEKISFAEAMKRVA